jgi:hypothetical protein
MLGQVTIPTGQTSATITLQALTDNLIEKNETITLILAGNGRGNSATVTIEKQKPTPHSRRRT